MIDALRKILNLRLGRPYFWVGLLILAAAVALLARPLPWLLNGGFVPAWLLLHAARFHDFGRSGTWAFAPIIAFLGLLTGLAMLNPPSAIYGGLAITAFVGLATFTLWVGAKRGDPGPNRFAPGYRV